MTAGCLLGMGGECDRGQNNANDVALRADEYARHGIPLKLSDRPNAPGWRIQAGSCDSANCASTWVVFEQNRLVNGRQAINSDG